MYGSVSDDNSLSLTLKMRITNVMVQGDLGCRIDFKELVLKRSNVSYQPQRFSGIVWQHRKIGGNYLVFASGKLNCAGKYSTVREGIQRLRRYARLLQRSGYPVKLCGVRVITTSATHQLNGTINTRMFQEGRC
jgi:TATA-box binding protein (TBP) (component of TFIID and TFIIIB)